MAEKIDAETKALKKRLRDLQTERRFLVLTSADIAGRAADALAENRMDEHAAQMGRFADRVTKIALLIAESHAVMDMLGIDYK